MLLDGEKCEEVILEIDIRRIAGWSFSGVGRCVDFGGAVARVVLKEASVSRLRECRFCALEGEVLGTNMSTIWGLPTMINDITLAVSSCDFRLEALDDNALGASASSGLMSSRSVSESS